MVALSKEDILQTLQYHKILDESENIKDDNKFRKLIVAVFLGMVSLERIKSSWKKEAREESVFQNKIEKIRPHYHRPFHYVGFGDKTLFISEKQIHERFFYQEFIKQFVVRIEDIDLIRRACNLTLKITDAQIKSHVGCKPELDKFCAECKNKFSEELLKNHKDFLFPLQVKSYTILDISIETIMAFINEDDLIEELEENTCQKCKRFVFEYFKYCPDCGEKIKKVNSPSPINREKVFNELVSIYLNKKTGINCEANKYLNDSYIETDILVSNKDKNLAIEGTTIVNLDKNYLNKKLTTLLFLDVLFPKPKNKLILWSLDHLGDKQENIEFVNKIAKGSLEIMKSLSTIPLMQNNSVAIIQTDLESLIKEVNFFIDELLTKLQDYK